MHKKYDPEIRKVRLKKGYKQRWVTKNKKNR